MGNPVLLDASKFRWAESFIAVHGIEAFNALPESMRAQIANSPSQNKHVMRNGSIEIIGVKVAKSRGRHHLSNCWSWDRSLRFKVNLHGGAFG